MTTKIVISRREHSDEEVKREIKKVLDILNERYYDEFFVHPAICGNDEHFSTKHCKVYYVQTCRDFTADYYYCEDYERPVTSPCLYCGRYIRDDLVDLIIDIEKRERKSMNKINTNRVDYTKMSSPRHRFEMTQDIVNYVRQDALDALTFYSVDYLKEVPVITNVIFNEPATIVFWKDGTKTVVKAQGDDEFDPEKGLAMAVNKKVLGTNISKSNYYDIFKKWIPEEPDNESDVPLEEKMRLHISNLAKDPNESFNDFLNRMNKKVEDKPSLEAQLFDSVSKENKALKEELESLKEEKRHMQAEIEYLKKSKEILTSVNFVEKER